MNRRKFLSSTVASGFMTTLPPLQAKVESPGVEPKKPGLTIASYRHRWRKRGTEQAGTPPWQNALDVLDHCHELGVGCLQIGVSKWTTDFAGSVRERRESLGIEIEGQIRLPWKERDAAKFESDLLAAKEAGAGILRAVCLSGRRYETFQSHEDWLAFQKDSKIALERAEPILAKHNVSLGFENHKDWRAEEHVGLLKHLDSEFVGVTFDFGNNIALLEDPYEVAEALSPHIVSTHMKDMAVAEYEEGFLLSEVPLGSGILDLNRLIKICRKNNPDVRFNLEMITRDPLEVPVLTNSYWTTLASVPGSDLAKTLTLAKQGNSAELPWVHQLSESEYLAFEEKQIIESFRFARSDLGFL